MVPTSAPLPPTALLQLTHLIVGQSTSAPAVELGHLAVQALDEDGQISQLGHVSHTTRSDMRGANRRPAGASSPWRGDHHLAP
jgi:hypothetical protein